MNKKRQIISQLKVNGVMTQSELAEAIYGDKHHTTYIYPALMSLLKCNKIIRTGAYPARYCLNNVSMSEYEEIEKSNIQNLRDMRILQTNVRQKTFTMSAEYAIRLIREYFNETLKDVHCRYMSWEHCYKAFSECRGKVDEKTVDYLALHLAFYLASWGMYRGSSFLLRKDYKIHIPVVRIIQEEKYNSLYGISADNLCKVSNLALLEEISVKIKSSYAGAKPVYNGVFNKATDTLTTKILLGTLGCVPAYDRYYVQSLKKYGLSTNGRYNRKSICCVAQFYCDNFDKFEKLRMELSMSGINYPPMKLMDMCFWQDAYSNDLKQLNVKNEKFA